MRLICTRIGLPLKTDSSLLLGDWVIDQDHFLKSIDIPVADYCYSDRALLKADFDLSITLSKKIAAILVPSLNHLHNLSWREETWDKVLYPWLLIFVQVVIERYRSLVNTIKNYEVTEIVLSEPSSYVSPDYKTFDQNILYDDYNQLLYTSIFEYLSFHNNVRPIYVGKISIPENNYIVKWKALRSFFSFFGTSLRKRHVFMSGEYFSLRQRLTVFLKSLGKVRPFFDKIEPQFVPVSLPLREALVTTLDAVRGSIDDDVSKIYDCLLTLIPKYIPKSYLESFYGVYSKRNPYIRRFSHSTLLCSNRIQLEDELKIICACAKEEAPDFSLFISQHGGFYGISKWSTPEYVEKYISDKFLNWGWEDSDRSRPLSHPRFFDVFSGKKYHEPNGDILFIDNITPRFFYKNWSSPIGSMDPNYYKTVLPFFDEVSSKLNQKIRMRTYYSDRETGWRKYLKIHYNQFEFEDIPDISFEKSIAAAKVVVCWHNQTTFIETIYYNKPTILFWDPHYWEIREDAEPLFEKMRSVGLFFTNPLEAAEFLTSNINAIEAWWFSKPLQDVRLAFLSRYARRNKNWVKDLMKLAKI